MANSKIKQSVSKLKHIWVSKETLTQICNILDIDYIGYTGGEDPLGATKHMLKSIRPDLMFRIKYIMPMGSRRIPIIDLHSKHPKCRFPILFPYKLRIKQEKVKVE